MIVDFPDRLVREADHDWNVVGNTMNAGQTSAASIDVRSDGGGFWSASLNAILLEDRRDVMLWRAVRQIADGGVCPLIVPRLDRMQPFPAGQALGSIIPHDDGTLFDDGSGYTQSVIDVVAAEAAALRATAMTFELINCGELIGGEAFSIEHPNFGWRVYEIRTVAPGEDDVVSVTFKPPLREDVDEGAPIEFDRPRCVMKLATPGAMDLNLKRLPCPASVKFIEAKYR
jgi:hypothetical protein